MKRYIFTLGLAILATTMLQAAQVSESAARTIAAQFMQARGMGAIAPSQPMKAPQHGGEQLQTDDAAYYVFNAQSGHGFVIVSGDDRTQQPVLGYSNESSFDPDNMPENMRWWLMQYATEIAMLNAGVIQTDMEPAMGDIPMKAGAAILPLTKSQWGQGAPFNLQCPKVGNEYCVTGCVATAMAQIMYYHKWPTSTSTTIPSYTVEGTTYSALAATAFQYGKMKNYYSRSDTSTTNEANAAVAKLMHYCGQAVQMEYGTKSSSAVAECEAMVDFFKFSSKSRFLYRWDYSFSQWQNYILTELQASRPVIYSARTLSGGHAFVCDGYDGNGYFHINWGWYGSQDGYFLLSALTPGGGGIGSSDSPNGYMLNHRIIIGLEPNTISTTEKNAVIDCIDLDVDKTTYTRSSSSDPFVITVTVENKNKSVRPRTYDMGWGVYKSDGFTQYQIYNSLSGRLVESTASVAFTRTLNFGKDFANGTYYLRPICREKGNSTWFPCHNSGRSYIKAVVNGNNLTLTTHKFSEYPEVTGSIYAYSTLKKIYRPLTVDVIVTNNSITEFLPIFLHANNELVAGNSIMLSRGSSGHVQLTYTPNKSGTHNLKVYCSNTLICTGSVSVAKASESSLTITSTVPAANSSNQVTGKSISFKVTATNKLTTTYNDYIYCKLYHEYSSGESALVDEKYWSVNIAGGNSNTTTVTFNDLSHGKYFAAFYYYSYYSGVLASESNIYEVGYPASLSVTYNIPEANSDHQIVGDKITVNAKVKNNRTTNYNSDFIVKLYYKTLLGNVVTATKSIPLDIPGSSSVDETFTFNDISKGNYFIKFFYYDYDNQKLALQTATYQVLGTIKGDVNGDGKVNVSDVTALVNMILGVSAMDSSRADVNGDGKVNVSDVTALINIILGVS